jgi:hypothetical protein
MSQAVSNTSRDLDDGCTEPFTHATRMLAGQVVDGLAGANDVCADHGDKPCRERNFDSAPLPPRPGASHP